MYKILVSLDQALDETENCLKSQLGVLDQWPKPMSQTKRPKPNDKAQGLRPTW